MTSAVAAAMVVRGRDERRSMCGVRGRAEGGRRHEATTRQPRWQTRPAPPDRSATPLILLSARPRHSESGFLVYERHSHSEDLMSRCYLATSAALLLLALSGRPAHAQAALPTPITASARKPEVHPRIRSAIRELEAAKVELEKAPHYFGGHR